MFLLASMIIGQNCRATIQLMMDHVSFFFYLTIIIIIQYETRERERKIIAFKSFLYVSFKGYIQSIYSTIHCLLPQVSFDRTTTTKKKKKQVIQHKLIHILSLCLFQCMRQGEREIERGEKRREKNIFLLLLLLLFY